MTRDELYTCEWCAYVWRAAEKPETCRRCGSLGELEPLTEAESALIVEAVLA